MTERNWVATCLPPARWQAGGAHRQVNVDTRSNRESMSFSPQIRFKMQKDGEPVWDQTTIDRLWVTTQREAMIESGPPPATATNPPPSGASEQKVQKEQTKK